MYTALQDDSESQGGGRLLWFEYEISPEANVLSLFWEVLESLRDEAYLGNYQFGKGVSEK